MDANDNPMQYVLVYEDGSTEGLFQSPASAEKYRLARIAELSHLVQRYKDAVVRGPLTPLEKIEMPS